MKTIEIKMDALKKLEPATLGTLVEAMVDELIERRGVRDPELFKYNFAFAAKGCKTNEEILENFCGIAWEAFHDYHIDRKRQRAAKAEAEAAKAEVDTTETADEAEAAETEAAGA